MTTLRLCTLVLALVAVQWVQGAPVCDTEKDPKCERMTDIGEAHMERMPTGRRFLLQTPRTPSAQFQNMAPHLANRRSLLAPMCSETDTSADAVIACTNAVRSSPQSFAGDMRCGGVPNRGGLGPLRKDNKLSQAALKHAKDNAQMGDLTHTGSDGSSVGTRVKRTGYNYRMVRENIAWGYDSAKEVVMGWMCSSGHRDNIMSCDVADIGVGIASGGGRAYHAQVFACANGESCGCGGSGRADDPSSPGDSGSGSGSGHQGKDADSGSGGHGTDGGTDGKSGSDRRYRDYYKDYYKKRGDRRSGERGSGEHGPGEQGSGEHGPSGEGSGQHGPGEQGSGEHGPSGEGSGGHGPSGEGSGGHGPGEHGPGSGPGDSPYGEPYRRRYRRFSPGSDPSRRRGRRDMGPHRSRRGGEEEGEEGYKKYKYGPRDQMYGGHESGPHGFDPAQSGEYGHGYYGK